MAPLHELSVVGIYESLEVLERNQWRVGGGDIVLDDENVNTRLDQHIELFQVVFEHDLSDSVYEVRIDRHPDHQVFHRDEAPASNKDPPHHPEEGDLSLEALSRKIQQQEVLPLGLGPPVALQLSRIPDRVLLGHRDSVGAPMGNDAPIVPDTFLIELFFVADFEAGYAVNAKRLVDQE